MSDEIEFPKEFYDFIEINNKEWNEMVNDCSSRCLIEGFALWPTHITQVSRAAKAIEDKYNLESIVLFNKECHKSNKFKEMYGSFKISKFIYFDSVQKSLKFIISSFFKFIISAIRLRSINDLIKLKYKDVLIGDLIFDSLLATNNDLNIKLNLKAYSTLYKAFVKFNSYRYIIKKNKVKYLVLGDKEYIGNGILLRCAIKSGSKVIVAGGPRAKVYNKENFNQAFLHPNKSLTKLKDTFANDIPSVISYMDEYLENRLRGNISQHDVKNTYLNKKTYKRDELTSKLALDKNKMNIFILPHAFSDAPHNSSYLLFRDYYDWFVRVMEIIPVNQSVNWILKPHPSAYHYGEDGFVESYIEKNNISNLKIVPKDFSTASLIDCADLIVTVQGTAALEYSCFGIPSCISGAGYYSGYGFTKEFSSKEEYLHHLSKIESVGRLDNEQVNSAKLVMYYSYVQSIIDDKFPSSIVLPHELNNSEKYLAKIRSNFLDMLKDFNITKKSNYYKEIRNIV